MSDSPTWRDSNAEATGNDILQNRPHYKKRRHGDSVPALGGNVVADVASFHGHGGSHGLTNQPQLPLGQTLPDHTFGESRNTRPIRTSLATMFISPCVFDA